VIPDRILFFELDGEGKKNPTPNAVYIRTLLQLESAVRKWIYVADALKGKAPIDGLSFLCARG
jgi:hypothetical protein